MQPTMIVYQMTEDQLRVFANCVVEQTRDLMIEEARRIVASVMGDRFEYCSVAEACEITGKTRQTLSAWVKKGRLHPVYNGNKMLFLREEVVREAGL